nr:hypothetical protein [Pedobacter sp. ASV2]
MLPSNWWETRNGHRPGELSDEQKAKIHLSTGKTVDDLKEGKTKSGTTER